MGSNATDGSGAPVIGGQGACCVRAHSFPPPVLPSVSRRSAALLALCALAACSRVSERSPNAAAEDALSATALSADARSAAATRQTLDGTTVREAERALSSWLSAAREVKETGEAGAGGMSALAADPACDDGGGSWFPTTLLADFVLLPSETRGDTVVGRAEVVTVAEQDIDRQARDRFVARQRIQRAVLEWDVVPAENGSWAICNGLRFGYRGSDSLTTWRPVGSSYQTARQLAESLFIAARHVSSTTSSPP